MSQAIVVKNNYLYALVLSLASLSLLFFGFRIKNVRCDYENRPEQLNGVCQELEREFIGRSLLFSDLANDSIWQKLLERRDYQESYYLLKVSRRLPNQIHLILKSKPPDYRLIFKNAQGEEKIFIINQNNRLREDQPDLSVLNIIYQGDEQIVDDFSRYLFDNYYLLFSSWQLAIEQWQIPVKEIIWQSNEQIRLDLGKSYLVVLDLELDFSKKMAVLAAILADENALEKIKGHQFLDLRFNLPVIRDQL